jgi:hypothetical protein
LTLAATWLWAAPAPGQPGTASGDAAAAAAAQAQVATETTGLVGDFNGDRRKDLFWYGPGASPTTCGSAVPTGTSPGCR